MPFSLQRSAGLSEGPGRSMTAQWRNHIQSPHRPGRAQARTSSSYHVLGDRSLANLDAELEHSPWMRGAPRAGLAVLIRPNQITNFALQWRAALISNAIAETSGSPDSTIGELWSA